MKQAIQVYIGLKRNQVKLTLPIHYTYSKLPRTTPSHALLSLIESEFPVQVD